MIFLDANATTPLNPEALAAMQPWLSGSFGNPSSAHAFGRRARQALEDARECVAGLLQARADEVIFTSGATEANNLALFGLVPETPSVLAINSTEHLCVLEPARKLSQRGHRIDWLNVNRQGVVEGSTIDPDTRLVAVMLVNHETGTIQPIAPLREQFRRIGPKALFHCDAAQAVGKLPVKFHELGVDSLSVSGHKFHGPTGAGLLLLRKGVPFRPLFYGGHQQQDRRPGTESVPLAIGLAKALELAEGRRQAAWERLRGLQAHFWELLKTGAAPAVCNSPEEGSPYVLNVSFPGCRAELLLMKLDMLGVACSTGSACSSGSLLPSPVLQAMGVEDDVLRSAMRFSWTVEITEGELERAAEIIVKAVREIRGWY